MFVRSCLTDVSTTSISLVDDDIDSVTNAILIKTIYDIDK